MKEGNKNIEEAGNTKKGIRWTLWLYGDASKIFLLY